MSIPAVCSGFREVFAATYTYAYDSVQRLPIFCYVALWGTWVFPFLYFNFKNNIIIVNTKTIKSETISGNDLIKMPYINQENCPVMSMTYIIKDTSSTDFVFQLFMTCGIKEIVVIKAAKSPISVI